MLYIEFGTQDYCYCHPIGIWEEINEGKEAKRRFEESILQKLEALEQGQETVKRVEAAFYRHLEEIAKGKESEKIAQEALELQHREMRRRLVTLEKKTHKKFFNWISGK